MQCPGRIASRDKEEDSRCLSYLTKTAEDLEVGNRPHPLIVRTVYCVLFFVEMAADLGAEHSFLPVIARWSEGLCVRMG